MKLQQEDVQLILTTLRENSKYDLTNYSEKSIQRRLEKVTDDFQLDVPKMLYKIKSDSSFPQKLVEAISVNTTEFFRDPNIWMQLRYDIYPKLKDISQINIWHAGCSTGQEIYSNLILLNELELLDKVKVFATDINNTVIERAKKGIYRYRLNYDQLINFDKVINRHPLNYDINRGVPYSKYFDINVKKDLLKIKPFLLNKVMFRQHDLINGDKSFFMKFHLIFCRNVLIYFNFNLQKKVLKTFHDNLNDLGFIILGQHESILEPKELNLKKQKDYYIPRPPDTIF